MKRLLVLCFVLNSFLFAGEFSLNSFSNSSHYLGNPAFLKESFNVSIFGNHPEKVDDYKNFGVYSNFPLVYFSSNFLFDYTSLDSLYQRIRGRWSVSKSVKMISFGVSYGNELEIAKGFDSWLNHFFLFGIQWKYDWVSFGVSYGNFSEDYSFYSSLFVFDFSNYKVSVEYGKEISSYWQISQIFEMGLWKVEAAYRYPLSQFFVGFSFTFRDFEFSLGKKAVSQNFSTSYWKIKKEFKK